MEYNFFLLILNSTGANNYNFLIPFAASITGAAVGAYFGLYLKERSDLVKTKKRENDEVDLIQYDLDRYMKFCDSALNNISEIITQKEKNNGLKFDHDDNFDKYKKEISVKFSSFNNDNVFFAAKIRVGLTRYIKLNEWWAHYKYNESSLVREGYDFYSKNSPIFKYGSKRYSQEFKYALMDLEVPLHRIANMKDMIFTKENPQFWYEFFFNLIEIKNRIDIIINRDLISLERQKIRYIN